MEHLFVYSCKANYVMTMIVISRCYQYVTWVLVRFSCVKQQICSVLPRLEMDFLSHFTSQASPRLRCDIALRKLHSPKTNQR